MYLTTKNKVRGQHGPVQDATFPQIKITSLRVYFSNATSEYEVLLELV